MKKYYFFGVVVLMISFTRIMAQPTQPNAPLPGNSSNCTPPVSEICQGNSTVVTSFTNATLRSGSPTSLPAVYSFYNVASVNGQQINATITIDQQLNCSMSGSNFSIDDDAATDQGGNSIASFFAPRITPASNLTNSDARGYVQFTIRFFIENGTSGQQYPGDYTTPPPFGGLSGLNYIHYDIDGSSVGNGGWFRETGLIENVSGSAILGNANTELTSYTYTDGVSWKGFAGSVYERDGVSRCAEVAAAVNYLTPQSSITVRMGYDYNYNGTSYNSRPTRQYGSRFGCFTFPVQTPLPVHLLSFSGALKNNIAVLQWEAENELNFSAYEIEKSETGINFSSLSVVSAKNAGFERQQYQYADNLTGTAGEVFYYRLRMIDIDGKFTYSNVIMIRKGGTKVDGIVLSPNPVASNGSLTVRFESGLSKSVEIRVIDMSGRVVLKQYNNVQEGSNSVSIKNMSGLMPGTYVLQMNDGVAVENVKFTIYR
ncbi:MAG TPA: T9SS type A sorting domain-containing protein [Chitinophagaceae bacterium]|nr:T9SS type A sorting domain-containing protein [Chitinophagaceae bacterium]